MPACSSKRTCAALRIGQGTLRKMRQNLAWATGYNAIALPIAAVVFAPPSASCSGPRGGYQKLGAAELCQILLDVCRRTSGLVTRWSSCPSAAAW